MSREKIPAEVRFSGVDELLGYIKKSITRCSKIGTDDIFYQIYRVLDLYFFLVSFLLDQKSDCVHNMLKHQKEYCNGLNKYAQMLVRHLPDPMTQAASSYNIKEKFITESELITICLVINTSDYVSEVLSSLETKLKS
ncbi:hypothetical protein RFI_20998, partial [Reticulomyxa filosa]